MKTISDILKESFLEGFQTDITTTKICITLGISVILGLYIYFIYKYKSKNCFYSKDFNNVLAGLPVVTSGIVLAMQSSIVISLGMVGALSIVRFRNAVKSSLDLMFLFWSISIGIIVGAGIYEIGFILSIVLTILMYILDYIPVKRCPYLLVLNSSDVDVEKSLMPILKKYTNIYTIKSRSIHSNMIDLIIEIRCKDEQQLISECLRLENIKSVNLLSHDGEIRI